MSINIIKKEYHDFDIEPLICLVTDSKKTASSLFFVPDCSCPKICERVGYSSIRAAKPQAGPVLVATLLAVLRYSTPPQIFEQKRDCSQSR